MAQRSLPVPPLLTALAAWQAGQTDDARTAVGEALASFGEALGFGGVRLAIEAPLLAPLEVGTGTLTDGRTHGAPLQLVAASDGGGLGGLWLDGGDDAARSEAANALAMALDAVRAQARADRAEGNLAALDAAVRGIAGVLDVQRVLQLIVDRVRDLAEAQYAALGIVDEEGVIERFVTSGISDEERERIGPLPRGHGLLGLIIRENRSFRITDINRDPRRYGFPPNHPPMTSFLGVPITVGSRTIGRLYLTNKRGAVEFGEADQELVERFALHAGIAMENARLHESERRLAVVEERERIGKDLHDSIIQSLYGVTLSLDDVPELVEEDPAEARERVDRAIDTLHGTIRDIRNFIFGLRPVLFEESGIGEALEALADEVRRNTTVEVDVHVEEPTFPPIEVVAELVSLTREALSNVARHSGASRARIELALVDDGLRLTIEDDGRGFDPSLPRPSRHQGIGNMSGRARGVGGSLRIESAPGAGTRIIVTVPIPGGFRR